MYLLEFLLSIFAITKDTNPFISTTPLPNNFLSFFISLKGLEDHFCPFTDTVSICPAKSIPFEISPWGLIKREHLFFVEL